MKELINRAERMYKLIREQEHDSEKGNITITVAQSSDVCQILAELVELVEIIENISKQ